MRKLHNDIKRRLISSVKYPGAKVLDVGCGQGGDIMKWSPLAIHACDPNTTALREAIRRAQGTGSTFFRGDITACPLEQYDIICYNFSFQYTFESRELFTRTMDAIVQRSKVGTKFIGIIPDSELILEKFPGWRDSVGNYFRFANEPNGDFGEYVLMNILGAPYYRNGPMGEPIAYKDIIISEFNKRGFALDHWYPIVPQSIGLMTDIYSEIIFTRVQ